MRLNTWNWVSEWVNERMRNRWNAMHRKFESMLMSVFKRWHFFYCMCASAGAIDERIQREREREQIHYWIFVHRKNEKSKLTIVNGYCILYCIVSFCSALFSSVLTYSTSRIYFAAKPNWKKWNENVIVYVFSSMVTPAKLLTHKVLCSMYKHLSSSSSSSWPNN